MVEFTKKYFATEFSLIQKYENESYTVLSKSEKYPPMIIEVNINPTQQFFHKAQMTSKVQQAMKGTMWKEWYRYEQSAVVFDLAYNFSETFIGALSRYLCIDITIQPTWLLLMPFFEGVKFDPDNYGNLRQIIATGLMQIAHLQQTVPGFRHNDIVFSNWVIQDDSLFFPYAFPLSNGKQTFVLNPESAVSLKKVCLFDFGLSSDFKSKLDFPDNSVIKQFAYLGITDTYNPLYDAHLFLTTIYNALRSKQNNNYTEEEKMFFAFVERYFKQSYLNSIDSLANLGICNRYDKTIPLKCEKVPDKAANKIIDGSALLIDQRLNKLVLSQVQKKTRHAHFIHMLERLKEDIVPPEPCYFGMDDWHDCNHIPSTTTVFDLLNDKYLCAGTPTPGIPLYTFISH